MILRKLRSLVFVCFIYISLKSFFCAHFTVLSFQQVRTVIPAGTSFQEDCGQNPEFKHFFDCYSTLCVIIVINTSM